METQSVLQCPFCLRKMLLEMPVTACQYFFKCVYCHELIRPRKGDCCVFCSYGSNKCPDRQIAC
jgi:hypothetical protein